MKKKLIKLLFLFAVLFTVSFSADAQIYVTIRPPVPVIVRPPQPTRAHIWINEEWRPDGGSYRYSGGYWETAPRQGYYRTSGYWKRTSHGQVWVQGNWKKGHHKKYKSQRRH